MGRVDSAIAGVQERDKWRRRLEALERSLDDLADRRRRLELRLARVHKELAKLQRTAVEFVEFHGRSAVPEVSLGPRGPILR
jgi:predicted  nucleic acid-binding Zn-ribbon protein